MTYHFGPPPPYDVSSQTHHILVGCFWSELNIGSKDDSFTPLNCMVGCW